jgi:hypothetical protein
MGFTDRRVAGRQLAARLEPLRGLDPIVLALPRGGVPVAAEVAARLGAPLDVLVVRKIGPRRSDRSPKVTQPDTSAAEPTVPLPAEAGGPVAVGVRRLSLCRRRANALTHGQMRFNRFECSSHTRPS